MIDKRELHERAREMHLPLAIVEKDYVLGWLLFALSNLDGLVFKGGTALAKVHFPRIWRLSEDLDFAFTGPDFGQITRRLKSPFTEVHKISGIELRLKSSYSNPDYLQLKVQYSAVLGKNWIKVDATKEKPIDKPKLMRVQSLYSDFPETHVRTESLEEIFAQKLRAILERKKCRDYLDVWKLIATDFNKPKLLRLFHAKCRAKGISFGGVNQFFPEGINDILRPYWEKELGRLVSPLPDMDRLLASLSRKLSTIFQKE